MREVVTVRLPAQRGVDPKQVMLSVGETVSFGRCCCGRCGLDLTIENEGTWFAGRVAAAAGGWTLGNLMSKLPLLVVNLKNPHEYFTVDPGQRQVPVPFQTARVLTAIDPDSYVTVIGPAPRSEQTQPGSCPGVPTEGLLLDPGATYYAVLRALCEPRLHGSTTTPLPTSEVIANELGLTARAVDAHVEYLIDKLGLVRGAGRDILVATAIRHRLVPVQILPERPGITSTKASRRGPSPRRRRHSTG